VNTIGADPELFLINMDTGESTPAYGLIGGTKEEPIPIPGMEAGYMMQEDGAALEFNIPPQVSSLAFYSCISVTYRTLRRLLESKRLLINANDNYIELSAKYLEDPRSKRFGCLADTCAYHDTQNWIERTPFTPEQMGSKRYAGGHIHVGYNKDRMPAWVAARFLDCYLGLPSIGHDNQIATGRRELYGLPGLYREKPYGIEYRTLSNQWVVKERGTFSTAGVANNALSFTDDVDDNIDAMHRLFPTIPWGDVQSAILKEDKKLATMLIDSMVNGGLHITRS
jgi:hypothetical protein